MRREESIARIRSRREPWDIAVIGGGATGMGVALDAAARGYETVLVEARDFGSGTSSRSTKIVHGGVRYLEQGNVSLVREALHERAVLLRNAPGYVRRLAFVVPAYRWWERAYYGAGLTLYGLLAGRAGFGRTELLSRAEALERSPGLRREGLRGGVVYWDGQFDDARLLIGLAREAAARGATLANYAPVVAAEERRLVARDDETGDELVLKARVVVNAAGPYVDEVRRLRAPGAAAMIAPSQGAHVVLERSFLPGDCAVMVPKTDDGRVMFAIPWHGHTLAGTTETALAAAPADPKPLEEEIEFILRTAGRYLARRPRREDVLSSWAGVRPLVRKEHGGSTAALSRDHVIKVEAGMLTITGGKWTTYRRMAEDCVNQAARAAGLPERPCVTRELEIGGSDEPAGGERLHADLPYGVNDVRRAVREEMARTVEDVLARRTRASFLNARAAEEISGRVAELMRAIQPGVHGSDAEM